MIDTNDSLLSLTRRAGRARMSGLSPAQRQALARSGGQARYHALSARQRSSIARRAALALHARRKAVKDSDILANTLASKAVKDKAPEAV